MKALRIVLASPHLAEELRPLWQGRLDHLVAAPDRWLFQRIRESLDKTMRYIDMVEKGLIKPKELSKDHKRPASRYGNKVNWSPRPDWMSDPSKPT